MVLKVRVIEMIHPSKSLPKDPNSARTLTIVLMVYGASTERKLEVMAKSGLKS
jgi:hypothetical protein